MGISKKIYSLGLKIKEITSRKSFNVILISVLAVFFFFGVFNVYAQGGEEIQLKPAWEGTKKFHNIASGLSGAQENEDNMNSRQGTEILNTAWSLVSLAAPEITGINEANSQHLPYDLRRGLIGMVDDASTAAYALYPSVDISEHLAQQWVPGYAESVASYAASSAAESGYQALKQGGITKIWARTLNLSYIFFVIVMVIAGFMIMFRHKLGGQTMVTLGTILPQVIISLVLATFSFAIAGFIIDLGVVLNNLIKFILTEKGNLSSIFGPGSLISGALGGDGTLWGTIEAVTKTFGTSLLFGAFKTDSALGILNAVVQTTMLTTSFVVSPALTGLWGLIQILFVVGIIFLGAIRVTIVLFKAYFGILMNVILGPIQLTLGAIPGNNKMIKNWFSSLLRNVMVFPAILFIVNIPRAIEETIGSDLSIAIPPKLVGQDSAGFMGFVDGQLDSGRLLVMFLRIFVLFYAAQAPKFLEAIFPPTTPKPFTEGMALGKASVSKVPLVGRFFREKK